VTPLPGGGQHPADPSPPRAAAGAAPVPRSTRARSGAMRSSIIRHVRRLVYPALALASVTGRGAASGPPEPRPAQDSLAAAVDAMLRPLVASGNFSGLVLVARAGTVLVEAGYGSADVARGTAPRGDQSFVIGSITKTFTAAAVLLLAQRGMVDLDAPLTRFVADFPHGERITVRQLLEHESGLPNLFFRPDYAELAQRHYDRPRDVLALVGADALLFEPGARYAYNNLNYSGLAWLIEEVADTPYAEFLQREFLEPLALRSTGIVQGSAASIPRLASGHDPVGVSGLQHERATDRSILVGAGSMYATARDLWRWVEAVEHRQVLRGLTDSLVSEYFGQQRTIHGRRARVASGWDGIGYTAHMISMPEEHLTVVVLGNVNIASVAGEIAEGITALVLGGGPRITAFARASPPPDFLALLAGRYRFGNDFYVPNGVLELVVRDGTLFDLSRTPAAALLPLADGAFLYRPTWATVQFLRDDGQVTGIRFSDRFVATKEPGAP
jgi:CubicO group peptidase (beta-lactamase class C family)